MENCGRLSSTEKTRTIQFLWVYVSIRKQTKNTGSTAINYGRCGDAIIRDLLVKSASKPTKVKRKKTADVRSTRARHSMLRCRATKIVQLCLHKMEKSIDVYPWMLQCMYQSVKTPIVDWSPLFSWRGYWEKIERWQMYTHTKQSCTTTTVSMYQYVSALVVHHSTWVT